MTQFIWGRWNNGAAICFQSRIFRGEISRKIREFLKMARRGFSDLLQGMWDYIKSYEHHLNTLNTPWASLSSPKVPLRPWCPEIFGGNHPKFLEISDFCLDLWHGYHRNRLDEPVKNFDFFLDFRPDFRKPVVQGASQNVKIGFHCF